MLDDNKDYRLHVVQDDLIRCPLRRHGGCGLKPLALTTSRSGCQLSPFYRQLSGSLRVSLQSHNKRLISESSIDCACVCVN